MDISSIDYQSEKERYLNDSLKSKHTRSGYEAGIRRLEQYATSINIQVLELTPAQADDFIYELSRECAPATTHIRVSAASAFFTWLHRRHKSIENPFRGTRARPRKKAAKPVVVPSPEEVQLILDRAPAIEKAMVSVMVLRGLRVGALPGLVLKGRQFTTISKGKTITGTFPMEVLNAIHAAGLPERTPFAQWTDIGIKCRVGYQLEKLYHHELISDRYSCHDLRHRFAMDEYAKDKDIRRVSRLLFHENISITDGYLKGLGVTDSDDKANFVDNASANYRVSIVENTVNGWLAMDTPDIDTGADETPVTVKTVETRNRSDMAAPAMSPIIVPQTKEKQTLIAPMSSQPAILPATANITEVKTQITTPQIAKRLGCHETTILRIAHKIFPPGRIPRGRNYWTPEECAQIELAWQARQTVNKKTKPDTAIDREP
jgi:site-specific recombinase XerD